MLSVAKLSKLTSSARKEQKERTAQAAKEQEKERKKALRSFLSTMRTVDSDIRKAAVGIFEQKVYPAIVRRAQLGKDSLTLHARADLGVNSIDEKPFSHRGTKNVLPIFEAQNSPDAISKGFLRTLKKVGVHDTAGWKAPDLEGDVGVNGTNDSQTFAVWSRWPIGAALLLLAHIKAHAIDTGLTVDSKFLIDERYVPGSVLDGTSGSTHYSVHGEVTISWPVQDSRRKKRP